MPLGGALLDDAAASAARGDRAALEQVLEAIRPMVVGHCRAKLGAELGTDAADATAERICETILTTLPRRKDADRPFLSFVYETTVQHVDRALADDAVEAGENVTSLAQRRAARDTGATPATAPFGGTVGRPEIAEGDANRRMRELLARLPEREREVLMLRVAGGLSAEEAAAATATSPSVVRLDQHRALRRLRAIVANRNSSPVG